MSHRGYSGAEHDYRGDVGIGRCRRCDQTSCMHPRPSATYEQNERHQFEYNRKGQWYRTVNDGGDWGQQIAAVAAATKKAPRINIERLRKAIDAIKKYPGLISMGMTRGTNVLKGI